jgi:phage-related protein
MLEKQSNTLGGIINKFKSLKAATAEAIGTGVSEELKDLLKYILDIGKKGQDVFVNGMVRVIKEVIHWIYQAIITVKLIGYALEDLGINFEPLIVFVKSLADSFENTMLGILPFLEKIGVLLLAVGNNIARFLTPIIKEVGEIARDVFGTLAQWLDPVIKLVQASSGTFEVLGNIIAKLLRPALAVAVGIKGITLAIAGIKAVTGGITAVSTAFKLLTGSMSVMKAAAEGNKLAMIMLDAQMLKSKAITLAKTAAEKIAALATKAWSVVQMAFNAVMSANPIALIILAVIALVAAAILLIKNWDKVKAFFIAFGKKIAEIFTVLVAKIKQMFSAVIQWIKNVWSKISDFFSSLWNGIVNVAMQIWDSLKTWFASFIEGIKAVWGVITDFFSDLWNGIVDATRFLWEPLVEWFTGLIDGIKTVWNGITGFFSGLWEAIMNGPAAAIEYIRTAFTSLFSGIEEKLFGFINKVKEGWDKVTGFFGNAVTGVVNFFTGGDPEIEKTAPTKVNDMILTPEGQYQTSPDDYIMAMKNPMDLVDAVLRFLGQGLGGMPEPALAGAAGQGMMDAAMYQAAAAPTNYNNSTSSYSESFQAPITVNVNAASMSPQEAQAAVQRGVEDALKNAINSSRGNIPKPEVERY